MSALQSINTKHGKIFFNREYNGIKLYFLTPEHINLKYKKYPKGFILDFLFPFNADVFEKLFSNPNAIFANDFLDIITYNNFEWLDSSFYAGYHGPDKERRMRNKNELVFKEALSSGAKSTEFKDFFKNCQFIYLVTPISPDFSIGSLST